MKTDKKKQRRNAKIDLAAVPIRRKPWKSVKRARGRERTCIHCGCTDSRACPGGCSWLEVHKATPTGVCSCCGPVGGIQIGTITIAKITAGNVYLHNHEGCEGMEMTEKKLAKVIQKFFDKEF